MDDGLPNEDDILKPGAPPSIDMGETTIVTEDNDDELEIEVVDDTPEKDKGRKRATSEEELPEDPTDDEMRGYTENVQKRIKQLTYKAHEERRQREDRERQLNALAEYTKGVLAQANQKQAALAQGEALLVQQARARVTAEVERARKAYKDAYEAGDSDALLKAQEDIARLQVDWDKLNSYRPQYAGQPSQQGPQTPAPAQQQTQAPAQPQADPRAIEWQKQNQWFLKDQEMTRFAQGLHDKLVTDGIDPRGDAYWRMLDDGIKKRFPERFEAVSGQIETPKKRVTSPVAPAARAVAGAPKKVQLTSSELAIAKRLGITPQQYAAQKMRMTK